jgi:L-ornithine Nalpha-acyltransferase
MIVDDPHLHLRLAASEVDLLAARRLRYAVFVEELGGDGPLVDHARRLEQDRFDPFFDHLVLVDDRRDAGALDHVIGVYRVMRDDQARAGAGFYSAGEYDLGPLERSGRRLLELGRSCVHRDYRGGTAMLHLWTGLAAYVRDHGIEILFGVASFPGTDTAALAQPLSYLHHHHLAPPALRVQARERGGRAWTSCPRPDRSSGGDAGDARAHQGLPPPRRRRGGGGMDRPRLPHDGRLPRDGHRAHERTPARLYDRGRA